MQSVKAVCRIAPTTGRISAFALNQTIEFTDQRDVMDLCGLSERFNGRARHFVSVFAD